MTLNYALDYITLLRFLLLLILEVVLTNLRSHAFKNVILHVEVPEVAVLVVIVIVVSENGILHLEKQEAVRVE